MRIDKLTTKFQEALSDAQTLALGNDNASIEVPHLTIALLDQSEGVTPLLQRAGVNTSGLKKGAQALLERAPKTTSREQVQVGRDVVTLLQLAEKEAKRLLLDAQTERYLIVYVSL